MHLYSGVVVVRKMPDGARDDAQRRATHDFFGEKQTPKKNAKDVRRAAGGRCFTLGCDNVF